MIPRPDKSQQYQIEPDHGKHLLPDSSTEQGFKKKSILTIHSTLSALLTISEGAFVGEFGYRTVIEGGTPKPVVLPDVMPFCKV